MKRTPIWCILAALTAITFGSLAGCGGDDGAPSDGNAGSSAGKRFLQLGTAPVGGAFDVVGGALVEVANEFKPDSVGKFEKKGTKGSQQNIRELDSGNLDFALSNAAITYFAVRGQGDWDKKYDVKNVMTLAPNVAMFITLESSGIKSIADLKDKRVSTGPSGAGFRYFVEPLLTGHGVQWDDFSEQSATQSTAVELLGDGAIDAAFLGGAVPTSSIIQACSTHDIYFIPFDESVRLKLIEEYAFFKPAAIPAGTYSDLASEFVGLNVGSMHLITRGSQDEGLVYQVTKTIYENREEVVKKHAAGKAINPKVVIQDVGTEFHPGAIRFYKEIGIWPEDDAADDEATADEADVEKSPAQENEAAPAEAGNAQPENKEAAPTDSPADNNEE